MYHEYLINGKLVRREGNGYSIHDDDDDPYAQSDELIRMKILLGAVLGKDGFYAWASTLPGYVVMSDARYIAAIQAKMQEILNSNVAQEIPDVTILEAENEPILVDSFRPGGDWHPADPAPGSDRHSLPPGDHLS